MTTENYVIDVKNLNKNFGTIHAVNNVSLQVKKGEIFGFLGPNGSGKTTTIRMLCGLLTPDSGSGRCAGFDILTQSYQIKQRVGYMTQRFSYYSDMTVYENLDFVGRVYQLKNRAQKINKIIDRFDFTERRNQLTGQLSGGWQQRLALAACLLHEPELLLLDEPTAGVDPSTRRDFWEYIHQLSQEGTTTLISTHYMDEAERCTRLAYIARGSLIVEGTIGEVVAQEHLTTYLVKGKNLAFLAEQLKNIKDIQVVIFGESLHVSSKDPELLKKVIAPWLKKPDYQWQEINTTLEDVFIKLINESDAKE